MSRSWFTSAVRVAAPLALAALAACGDDNGTGTTNGGTLTGTQRANINATLARPDVMTAVSATGNSILAFGLADAAGAGLTSVGTLNFGAGASASRQLPAGKLILTPRAAVIQGPTGTYKAVGAQLILTDTSTLDVDHTVWTGIIAFDNLDHPTRLIVAGVVSSHTSTVSTIPTMAFEDGSNAPPFASAVYVKLIDSVTSTTYVTTGGTIAVTSTSFSGTNSCLSPELPPFITACNYAVGSMAGSFGFTATDGTDTVTIPTVNFDLPASRAGITLDDDLFNQGQ